MQVGKPIYWHEGLFLRPQHFQQFDEYCRHSIQSRFQYSEPYQWGVSCLTLVQAAVANEIVEIASLELMFKDGTQVNFPGNCRIPRRNISDMWDGSGNPLSIYIALRKNDIGRNNVNLKSSCDEEEGRLNSRATRYWLSDQGVNVADYYSDEKFSKLLFLDYQLQILVESEIESAVDYHVVKIAELIRSSGVVEVSSEYIPPLLQASSSTCLTGLVRNCLEQLVSLIRRLNNYDRSQCMDLQGQQVNYFKNMLVLQTLNRYRSLLEEILHNPNAKPYDIYLTFRQFLAELSMFSQQNHFDRGAENSPNHKARYEHENLFSILTLLSDQLSLLYSELITGPELIISLAYDGTYYSSKISELDQFATSSVYLLVKADIEADKLVHVLEYLSKLSSREQLPLLISRSITTKDLEYQQHPDYRLTRNEGAYYFKVDKTSTAWQAIRDDGNFAVYLGAKLNQCQMELVVLDD